MKRLFFALEFSLADKQLISRWRRQVMAPPERKIAYANLHMTLCFLGNVDQEQELELYHQAAGIEVSPFKLHFNRLGFLHRPGILYLAPEHDPAALLELGSQCRKVARSCGLELKSQRFLSHVSLYRGLPELPAVTTPPDLTFEFRHFVLYQSKGGESGVHYVKLASWPLHPQD